MDDETFNKREAASGREDGKHGYPMQGASEAYRRGYREGARKRLEDYAYSKADPYDVAWGEDR